MLKPRLTLTLLEDRAVPADASFAVINSWSGGLQGEIAITNPDGPAVNGWQLSFDYDGNVSQVWNASLVSHVGTRYTFADAGWNASIPVNGQTAFGFISTPSTTPTNYEFNGVSPPPPPVVVPPTPTPTTAGYLHTLGNKIVDSVGQNVKLAGVNWFGLESDTFAPHGLWARGYKSMMDQMKQLGFNTIRLPFSSQALEPASMANGIDFSKNPDLQGLNGLQVMDKIVDYAGQIGMRIFLDHHRSAAGAGADSGLWYEGAYTDARFQSDWAMLAARYLGQTAVIGGDLHNEPHGAATWGSNNLATDWRLAAERAGNAILAANPNWLIIVEGVENGTSGSTWWGGNLSAAGQFPVRLNVADRLVYSPHDYPASVYPQSWFSDANYPNNLPAVWDANWGYLFKTGTAPVLLGEFGTNYDTASDQVWLDRLTRYIGGDFDLNGTSDLAPGQLGLSWTFWSWNPNSGDTGGILNNDWQTVRTDKLEKLQSIMAPVATPTVVTVNGGSQRSRVTSLTLDFAIPVDAASLTAPGAIALTSGSTVVQTGSTGAAGRVTLSPATGMVTSITLTFSNANGDPVSAGVEYGSLSDGRWTLTIPSLSHSSSLHRLFGDINGDGTVDGPNDFAAIGAVFGKTIVDSPFDFNNDGLIDGPNDFAAFGARFGKTD